jgi:hypothetical protein
MKNSSATQETNEVPANTLYLNKPQLLANLIDANEQYHVWGRGTGKSEGLLAHRAHRCMNLMPRSAGVNVAESYMQLLDRTLPPMLKRWQDMGLRRDVDFWVKRFPSKNLRLNMPHFTPETPEHSIFMRVNQSDVSVMRLVSQDRPGSSNGMSIDWIIGDEAKYLNKERLDQELAPTNRGNERYYSECHLHHSVCFTTDMPTSSEAKWIHEFEAHNDPEANEMILAIEHALYAIHQKAIKRGTYTKSETYQTQYYQRELAKIRKGLVFYSEASTLDNLEVLGVEFIRKLKRSLPEFVFRTAILNERPGKVENTFYPDLVDAHFYNALDYQFLDSIPENRWGQGAMDDCRKDGDLDKTRPLEVALDIGGRINVITIAQESDKHISVLNAMDVLHPQRIKHLAQQLNEYYRHYPRKDVVVYYDHTHIAKNPVSDKNPIDEFNDELDRLGWRVSPYYLGVTPSYRNRYVLMGLVLNGQPVDDDFYSIAFNKENTKRLRTAMEATKIKLGGPTGYEKDKRLEKDEDANQQEAPHYTDSLDILVFGMIKRRRHTTSRTSSLISF